MIEDIRERLAEFKINPVVLGFLMFTAIVAGLTSLYQIWVAAFFSLGFLFGGCAIIVGVVAERAMNNEPQEMVKEARETTELEQIEYSRVEAVRHEKNNLYDGIPNAFDS